MLPSACPQIRPVVKTGQHLEAEFESCGRVRCRAYIAAGNVPFVQSLMDGAGMTPADAQILSVALQLAIDWAAAQVARIQRATARKKVQWERSRAEARRPRKTKSTDPPGRRHPAKSSRQPRVGSPR